MDSPAESPVSLPENNASRPVPVKRPALWVPLAVKDFRRLFLGETVSVFGDQFYLVALPWLALQLTGSGLALGAVLMAAAIPRAVFMLAGGAMTDRFSPRSVMLVSNTGRLLVVGLMAVLVLMKFISLWQLYLLSMAFGFLDAFFYPAYISMVPALLDRDQLHSGNALMQGSMQLNTMIGPAPAGLLIAHAGLGIALAFDAATFGVSVWMLKLIRTASRLASSDPTEPQASDHKAFLHSIWEGIVYAAKDSAIRALMINIIVANLCVTGPFIVGMTWMAKHQFSGSLALGTMFSSFGAGAVVGTLIAGSLHKPFRAGMILLMAAAVYGLCTSLMGFQAHLWGASLLLGFIGVAGGFTNVNLMAFLQKRTDPAKMGRLMSLVMLCATGLVPISYLAAGAIVSLGTRVLFLAAGISLVTTMLFTSTNRKLWEV